MKSDAVFARNAIDAFFLSKPEPLQGYLLCLRECILALDKDISESWKYSMPFYHFRGRRFAFIWVRKQDQWPYIGIVDGNKIGHPALHTGERKRMKVLLLDPGKDVPVKKIGSILRLVLTLYRTATAEQERPAGHQRTGRTGGSQHRS